MRSSQNAQQNANQWALKKKEMMDKANRIKEERKQNLASLGEMALGSKTNYEMEKPRTSNSQQKQQFTQSDYNNNYRQQFKPNEDILDQQKYGTSNRANSSGKQQQYQQQYQQQQQQQYQQQQQQSQKQQQYSQPIQTSKIQNKPPSQEGNRKNTIPKPSMNNQNARQRQDEQYKQPEPQQPPRQNRGNQSSKIQPKNQAINSKPQPQTHYVDVFDDLPIKGGNNAIFNVNVVSEQLYQCTQGCGRSFAYAALQKHEPNCVKVFQKQRKPYDSQKDRIISNEQLNHLKNQKIIDKKYEKALSKKQDWKKQSEAFRAIVKAGKGGKISAAQQNLIKEAGQLNYVQCDYCGRKFNETAAQRHIPFCASKQKAIPRQPVPQKKYR